MILALRSFLSLIEFQRLLRSAFGRSCKQKASLQAQLEPIKQELNRGVKPKFPGVCEDAFFEYTRFFYRALWYWYTAWIYKKIDPI
jgi:hypothetical protein